MALRNTLREPPSTRTPRERSGMADGNAISQASNASFGICADIIVRVCANLLPGRLRARGQSVREHGSAVDQMRSHRLRRGFSKAVRPVLRPYARAPKKRGARPPAAHSAYLRGRRSDPPHLASPAQVTDGRTAIGICIDSTASGARCEWSVNDKGEIDICNKNGCVYCSSATVPMHRGITYSAPPAPVAPCRRGCHDASGHFQC